MLELMSGIPQSSQSNMRLYHRSYVVYTAQGIYQDQNLTECRNCIMQGCQDFAAPDTVPLRYEVVQHQPHGVGRVCIQISNWCWHPPQKHSAQA